MDIVLRIFLHLADGKYSLLRLLDDEGIDIRPVEQGPGQQPRLFEEDGHGIDFFPRRAAGMPDPYKRIGGEYGQDRAADHPVERRVSQHFRYIHRDLLDETLEIFRLIQQPPAEFGEAPEIIR